MLVPPDRSTEIAGILARLAAGETITHLETVRLKKDGTRVDDRTRHLGPRSL